MNEYLGKVEEFLRTLEVGFIRSADGSSLSAFWEDYNLTFTLDGGKILNVKMLLPWQLYSDWGTARLLQIANTWNSEHHFYKLYLVEVGRDVVAFEASASMWLGRVNDETIFDFVDAYTQCAAQLDKWLSDRTITERGS